MTRPGTKCSLLLFVLGFAVSCSLAISERAPAWIRGIYTGESPRPVLLSEADAWTAAAAIADNTPGAFVLMGSGRSMQPLYAPGTVLVFAHVSFDDLKAGQTVLYRNKKGRMVAHTLIAHARDGWRVRGLNNHIHDMEPVVASNLVGVVLAAFAPTELAPERRAMANRPGAAFLAVDPHL